ncbi:MAG: V-type ATPase subunit [Bacillota bacterium]
MLGLESKYAYATGRVRVLETRLLDRGRLDRMIDAPDVEGALKVLAEAGYVRVQLSERTHPVIEDIMAGEEQKLVTVVRETSPDAQLVEVITARWDFHNLKVMLKAKLHRMSPERAIARHGTVNPAIIERAIEGDPRDLAPHFALALEAAKVAHARRPVPESIDIAIDREMYRFLLDSAKALRISFLIRLIRREIDLLNLAAFFRGRRMGRDKGFVSEALVPGGEVDAAGLAAAYDQPFDTLLQSLAGTGYEAVAREAISAVSEGKPLTEFERLSDVAMVRLIREARYAPLGPEPLVGYIYARMRELGLVRLILVGKTSGMSRESMRERLRDVYV